MQVNPSFLPFLVTVILSVGFWLATHRLTEMHYFDGTRHRKYIQHAIRLSVTLIVIIAIVLSLPVSNNIRGQLITLIGVIISGVFAFSSTTVVANLMAGLILRFNKPFNTGDFIRVEKHFGRVIELGIFESEIQSEHSTIIALPNTFLVSKPIEVTSPDSAIVSAEVSLGYDVHHDLVEPILISAGEEIGLKDNFTQVLELGDFSITYRISGMLEDVKKLLTTQSNLRRAVLGLLHENKIEIVSPNFMNQRQITDTPPFIPKPPVKTTHKVDDKDEKEAEEVVFNKADEAEKAEKLSKRLNERIKTLKNEIDEAEGDAKNHLQAELERNQKRLEIVRDNEEEDDNTE